VRQGFRGRSFRFMFEMQAVECDTDSKIGANNRCRSGCSRLLEQDRRTARFLEVCCCPAHLVHPMSSLPLPRRGSVASLDCGNGSSVGRAPGVGPATSVLDPASRKGTER
jgi:hypothetical protein